MKRAGKVALITGTSPNIGSRIAKGMADEVAKVVCAHVNPDDAQLCALAIRQ